MVRSWLSVPDELVTVIFMVLNPLPSEVDILAVARLGSSPAKKLKGNALPPFN